MLNHTQTTYHDCRTANGYLLRALQGLRDNGPVSPMSGICGNYEHYLPDCTQEQQALVRHQLYALFQLWPFYSGAKEHPVSLTCPYPRETPDIKVFQPEYPITEKMARHYYAHNSLWDHTQPYGWMRWQLVYWIIDEIKRATGFEED